MAARDGSRAHVSRQRAQFVSGKQKERLFKRTKSEQLPLGTPDRFGGTTKPSIGASTLSAFGWVFAGLFLLFSIVAVANDGNPAAPAAFFGTAVTCWVIAAVVRPLEQIRDAINAQTRVLKRSMNREDG